MIDSIEIVNGAIPLTETEPKQQWTGEWSTQLYVRVVAGDLVGWGQILPAGGSSREPYSSLVRRLSSVLIGRDESDIDGLWMMMRRLTFSGGYGITTGAISGIDIALWDMGARNIRRPLASLLGGEPRKVKRYASLSRYAKTEEVVKVTGWLLEKGYRALKLHQSGRDALDSVRLVRKEYGGGFELSVDLNCAFGYAEAADFMKNSGKYELTWVEEPVWPPDDFDSLSKLNKLGPVAAGENFFSFFEFRRLLEMDALTYYQPDIAKIGGISPALQLLALAKQHQAKVAFHNRPDNGWVSTVASAHLAAALSSKALVESPPNSVPGEYFEFQGVIDENSITPGGPGLGIEPLETIPQSEEVVMLRFHEN